ncbi:uncharacterized protein V1516DRAFT_667717 [Lipomyces oligophaga]|uniref:uncharacterized protein n=1 Tax=Lipomyces oligophaga TaxID=45792 RepID=UPI0034CFAEEC
MDWFLYSLHMAYPDRIELKFIVWAGQVPRTFAVSSLAHKLRKAVPALSRELVPDPSDERAFPDKVAMREKDIEYREPLFQLARRIASGELPLDLVLSELSRGKYIFGAVSDASIATMRVHLQMNGRADEEQVLWMRRQ